MLYFSKIILIVGSFFLLQQEEEKFTFQEKSVLNWSDFKGSPNVHSSHHAAANTGMGYSWSYGTANGTLDFTYEVKSHFYPQLSWVKKEAADDYLLAHEQLHFEISELHARMLRKTMASYTIGRNIRRDLKIIYQKAEAKRRAMQTAYDTETRHSIDTLAQKQWRLKIKKMLQAHVAFAK